MPCPVTAPIIGEPRTIEPFWNDQYTQPLFASTE
jgi:hypothetical protein